MSGRVGGDLDQLTALHRTARHRAGDVEDGAREVAGAIAHFQSRSSDYVPSLPSHGARGEELAARLFGLGDRVGASRDAILAADRWVGTRAAIWVFEAELDRQAFVAGLRGSVAAWGRFRRAVLDRRHPEFWKHAAFKDTLDSVQRRLDKDAIDQLRAQRNSRNARIRGRLGRIDDWSDPWLKGEWWKTVRDDTSADARRLGGRGSGAARTFTGPLGQARTALSHSKLAAVGRIGSRFAAVGGVAVGVADVAHGRAEDDGGRIARGVLGAASGAALMSGVPPLQIAGAVVQGGLLVYEYRQEIAAVGRAVADAVVDDVRQQVELAGKVVRGAGDMVGAAATFVGGLF